MLDSQNVYGFNDFPIELQLLTLEKMDGNQLENAYFVNKHIKSLIDKNIIKQEIERIKNNHPAAGGLISYIAFKKYLKEEIENGNIIKINLKYFEGVNSLTFPYNFKDLLFKIHDNSIEAKLLLISNSGNYFDLFELFPKLSEESLASLVNDPIDNNSSITMNNYNMVKLFAKFYNAINKNDIETLESLQNLGLLFDTNKLPDEIQNKINNGEELEAFFDNYYEEFYDINVNFHENLNTMTAQDLVNMYFNCEKLPKYIFLENNYKFDLLSKIFELNNDLKINSNVLYSDSFALNFAIKTANISLFDILIKNGADLFPVYKSYNVDLTNSDKGEFICVQSNPIFTLLEGLKSTIQSKANSQEFDYEDFIKNVNLIFNKIISIAYHGNFQKKLIKLNYLGDRNYNLLEYLKSQIENIKEGDKFEVIKPFIQNCVEKIEELHVNLLIKYFKEGNLLKYQKILDISNKNNVPLNLNPNETIECSDEQKEIFMNQIVKYYQDAKIEKSLYNHRPCVKSQSDKKKWSEIFAKSSMEKLIKDEKHNDKIKNVSKRLVLKHYNRGGYESLINNLRACIKDQTDFDKFCKYMDDNNLTSTAKDYIKEYIEKVCKNNEQKSI